MNTHTKAKLIEQMREALQSVKAELKISNNKLRTAGEMSRCGSVREDVNSVMMAGLWRSNAALAIINKALAAAQQPWAVDAERGANQPPSASERNARWQRLTAELPKFPHTAESLWVWSNAEIEMLRAAGFRRFAETIRTESLFCIATTGIRIYLSRHPQPQLPWLDSPEVVKELAKVLCVHLGESVEIWYEFSFVITAIIAEIKRLAAEREV